MPDDVALAFESGGDAEVCAAMLDVLGSAGVRATIFLDGQWAERHPELTRSMTPLGHELGNHGYSHQDLRLLPDDAIGDELERTESVAERLAGRTTRPWLRPPYQQVDQRVRNAAARHGFRCLCRDALDGAHHIGPSTPDAILQRSLERAADGTVLVYHLNNRSTLSALPDVIARLRERGARLTSVSGLPAAPPERAALHPDFAALQVDAGYLRMLQSVPPPQMINLLEVGADRITPSDRLLAVGDSARGHAALMVFNGREPCRLDAVNGGGQVACIGGELVLEAEDVAGRPVCRAHLRAGDVLSLRSDWRVRLIPLPVPVRAILLMML